MHYTLASPYLIQNVFKGNFEIITQPPARSIYIYWELEKLAIWKNSNENMHLKILIRYNLGFLKNKDGAFYSPERRKYFLKPFIKLLESISVHLWGYSSPIRITVSKSISTWFGALYTCCKTEETNELPNQSKISIIEFYLFILLIWTLSQRPFSKLFWS